MNFNLGRDSGPSIIISDVNLQSKEAASNGVVEIMDVPKSESVIWERTNYAMERDIACYTKKKASYCLFLYRNTVSDKYMCQLLYSVFKSIVDDNKIKMPIPFTTEDFTLFINPPIQEDKDAYNW